MLTKVLEGSWMSERVQIGSTCFVQVQKVWVSFKIFDEEEEEVKSYDKEGEEKKSS